MKKNVEILFFRRHARIARDVDEPDVPTEALGYWPDLHRCVESHCQSHPEIMHYHRTRKQPIEFRYGEKFTRSLNAHCTTASLRMKLVDKLTRIVHRIPGSGLRATPIRERADLWHFYVSDSWRVFYRKKSGIMVLEEFSPHKKPSYFRR